MLQINQKQEKGYTVYNFTDRGTKYEVLTQDNKSFDVWSERLSSSWGPQLACYDSLSDLSKRSKTLSNLCALIRDNPTFDKIPD